MADLKGTSITWLGHATALITTPRGTNILIDPFIEYNPQYPKGHKLPDKIDLMLLTHAHTDHIADALPVAQKHGPKVIAMDELIIWLHSKGLKSDQGVGMNIGGSHKHADVTISLTEARHSSSITDGDKTLYGGEPSGMIIAVENGPTLYHAGDTSLFTDMKLIGELYHPDLAMLPIGDHYTMGPRLAAVAAKYLGVKAVLPIHFGTFPPLVGTPAQLEKELTGSGIAIIRAEAGKALS